MTDPQLNSSLFCWGMWGNPEFRRSPSSGGADARTRTGTAFATTAQGSCINLPIHPGTTMY